MRDAAVQAVLAGTLSLSQGRIPNRQQPPGSDKEWAELDRLACTWRVSPKTFLVWAEASVDLPPALVAHARPPSTRRRRPGRTEVNTQDRYDVLGAALAVMVADPERCQFEHGGWNVAKIARAVIEDAPKLWASGNAPLAERTIYDMLLRQFERAENLRSQRSAKDAA
jgi:hypothetical protein